MAFTAGITPPVTQLAKFLEPLENRKQPRISPKRFRAGFRADHPTDQHKPADSTVTKTSVPPSAPFRRLCAVSSAGFRLRGCMHFLRTPFRRRASWPHAPVRRMAAHGCDPPPAAHLRTCRAHPVWRHVAAPSPWFCAGWMHWGVMCSVHVAAARGRRCTVRQGRKQRATCRRTCSAQVTEAFPLRLCFFFLFYGRVSE